MSSPTESLSTRATGLSPFEIQVELERVRTRHLYLLEALPAHKGLGRVHPHLARDARPTGRLVQLVASSTRDDDQVLAGLESGRHRPLDVPGIEGVDIVVDDGHELDVANRVQRGDDRILAVTLVPLLDPDDDVEFAATSGGDVPRLGVRQHASQNLQDHWLIRQSK